MASQVSTGSPGMSRRQTPLTKSNDSRQINDKTPRSMSRVISSQTTTPVPERASNSTIDPIKRPEPTSADAINNVNSILTQLRINDSRKSIETESKRQDHLDKVVANLRDQHHILRKQQMELKDESDTTSYKDQDRSSGSEILTPATESFESELQVADKKPVAQNAAEMARIKQELERARTVINRQEMELAESRNLRHTMEQAMGPVSEAEFPLHTEGERVHVNHAQTGFNASARPFTSRAEPNWSVIDDGKADLATTLVNSGTARGRNWTLSQVGATNAIPVPHHGLPYVNPRETRPPGYAYGTGYQQTSPIHSNFVKSRAFSSGSSNIAYGIDERLLNTHGAGQFPELRRPGNQVRTNSTISDPMSPISPYGTTLVDTGNMPPAAAGQFPYLDRGFGGQTSPIAGQFPIGTGQLFATDSQYGLNGANGSSYVMPAEPMNYRRLLDKTVSCDWKYIVDKIVCNNDQQASIFLQQKLKVGTAEQKYEIVESIVNQAYPLMINRFGNFLVQRCFEHGTPDQVIAIANAIHGNVISLSMDPFGCHVIQKAFDSVPEDHKADMVRELLRRIPDTVIHRYACHVWQKLFELRWSGEPPQIMVKVNEALQGMWHEVALGETGSLVVQNIFENCVEEEKRPAIEEVIANIDLIAHGQFGNWCIQHLCEHGSPPDKRRVIDHILKNSYNYSIDQFASKVVEKCLKIGGPEFLDRYLGVITTARPDRPRIPLIDIAGDQYGNYLIQWILVNTHQHQREQVAVHIRKHMVSLRGSKFGSRVAMLCSNPASATRPGAASALVNPYGAPAQQRLGNRYR